MAPADIEAEKALLGACMLGGRKTVELVSELLPTGEVWFREAHKVIFAALDGVAHDKSGDGSVDIVSVKAWMGAALDEVGGLAYLMELESFTPRFDEVFVRHYAEIVRGKWILRRVIEAAQEAESFAYAADSRVFDADLDPLGAATKAAKAFHEIEEMALGQAGTEWLSMAQIATLPAAMPKMEQAMKYPGEMMGTRTGWLVLDRVTGGLDPTVFAILGGRPGSGKTAAAVSLMRRQAEEWGLRIAFFSLEMSRERIWWRMVCALAQVNPMRLRTGESLPANVQEKLRWAKGEIDKLPIYIDDCRGISPRDVRVRMRRAIRDFGADVAYLDHLHEAKPDPESNSGPTQTNGHTITSAIIRGLKDVNAELSRPIIALAQLNRASLRNEEKRPSMEFIRESGTAEEVIDFGWFVHRPEYHKKQKERGELVGSESLIVDEKEEEEAEFIVGKGRDGATATLPMVYRPALTEYAPLAEARNPWLRR